MTYLGACALLMLGACSTRGEQAAVEETADQIEEAHLAGREAARGFINKQIKDSLELQQELVKAGAQRARYDSMPHCRAAYDSAFISTVRTVNAKVAEELDRHRR